ncbi:MAG: hypothetical protein M0036_19010 [Desulfobacteraceae bacterium]|nr:hypothetical protein [Desulfobacteraceae bacterium]
MDKREALKIVLELAKNKKANDPAPACDPDKRRRAITIVQTMLSDLNWVF